MKNSFLFCLAVACIGFQSCNKEQSKKADVNSQVQSEKPVRTECYMAFYEKDTVNLKMDVFKNGNISGDMVMKFYNVPKKIGKIVGEFKGDTLFASYTFIEGTNEKITFKNPMAFLKRGEELILGNGTIQTTMGASYFVKGTPIDFDRVKFKLKNVDCKL